MITGKHIKAARAVLGIGVRDLATMSGVAMATVVHFETGGQSYSSTVAKLQRALEKQGIEFLNSGRPGIRWKPDNL
jgi:predicted transcriptional regulator